MTTYRIVPANLDCASGWVVKTTHDSGVVDTSVVYESFAKAKTAAESWLHLDEDWDKV